MFRKIAFFILFNLTLVTFSFAESLQLENDSIFKLTAVIIDANGNVLGSTEVSPHTQITWQRDASEQLLTENKPYVPYTVIWYCPEGKEYGIWTVAHPGSRVTSQASVGAKACKLKNPKKILEEAEKKQNIYDYSGN